MVSNGALIDTAENAAAHTKTFHYKMTQPFSTYLLSLAGGEMDVAVDQWEDKPLIYAVPKGMGSLIPTSFGDTKEMLTFYSERFGVKFAWPKYAQTCVFDFGGGMENVSATTLVAEALGGRAERTLGYGEPEFARVGASVVRRFDYLPQLGKYLAE